MLGMNQREGRIFRVALLCHIAFVLCVFTYGLIPSCEEEPEVVHIFELASPPPPPSAQIRPSPPKQTPKPVVQKPLPKPTPPKPKPVVKKQIGRAHV